MMQIFLDGKQVIPSDNAAVKMTSENPYFTKSASYTYDIVLPLSIEQNRRVFGFIDRMDTHKQQQRMEAKLFVSGMLLLSGSAFITQVDEEDVKVQLLGAGAAYNYGNKIDKLFIDELPLGDWLTTSFPDGSYYDETGDKVTMYPEYLERCTSTVVFERAGHYGADKEEFDDILLDRCIFNAVLRDNKLPWTAYPVVNSNIDEVCNNVAVRVNGVGGLETFYKRFVGEGLTKQEDGTYRPDITCVSAVQPYVWLMAEKIAKATGFDLPRADNALFTNVLFNKIFIVNTDTSNLCSRCLPHWSVNEWWEQVERMFGVIVAVDYVSKTMSLKTRSTYYSTDAKTQELPLIVDEYTADVDDSTEADISVSNVGYADFENAPADRLSDDILKYAIINTEYADVAALLEWGNSLKAQNKEPAKNIVFECADGRRYIYTNNEFVEVDMFRNRMANPESDNIDIELKFVPARFVNYECPIYNVPTSGGVYTKEATVFDYLPVRVLQIPGVGESVWRGEDMQQLDIGLALSEDEDAEKQDLSAKDDKPDIIYVAIDMKNFDRTYLRDDSELIATTNYIAYPRAFLRQYTYAPLGDTPRSQDSTYSLSINKVTGQKNMYSETVEQATKADTSVRYSIKFVCDNIPNPCDIFLIRNKRFLCEKIEVNITASGLDKLLTGYFYELSV